jgi:lysophospholipase L1-like esterase
MPQNLFQTRTRIRLMARLIEMKCIRFIRIPLARGGSFCSTCVQLFPIMVRRVVLAGIVAILAALAWPEVPRFTGGGARMLLHPALPPAEAMIRLDAPGKLILQGDSNTKSGRDGGYPARLARRVGSGIAIEVRAGGGHTAARGASRWPRPPSGALVILMYGTNDAGPRGLFGSHAPTGIDTYQRTLSALARRMKAHGARVVILAPPPSASPAMERRLMPYRIAAQRAAVASGAAFRDPVSAFSGQGAELTRDGLHLSPLGQERLAAWLAAQITMILPGAAQPPA